jgi:hypothetical protein
MMFNQHNNVMGKFTAELQVAKLSQAVNDKDQELFESQELVAALLEALETLSVVADTPYPVDKQWLVHFVAAAIRKAKGE